MIKSFILSFVIGITFVALLISGEQVFARKSSQESANLTLMNNGKVVFASEEDSYDTESNRLLLGKDGTVLDTSQTGVDLQIVDPDNYSYKY